MAFKSARTREKNEHLLIEIWGREKAGKSGWALTAPPPLYYFNFDKGYDRVEKDMLRRSASIPIVPPFKERYDKDLIQVSDYTPRLSDDSLQIVNTKAGNDLLEEFQADWKAAVKKPGGGTCVIDTATIIWNVATEVLQKKVPANQSWNAYQYRNSFFKRLLDSARSAGKHVIFLHHDTDMYGAEGMITGQRAQGDKYVSKAADVICRMTARKTKAGKPDFILRVEDCGLNASVTGLELVDCVWDDLIDLAIPEAA